MSKAMSTYHEFVQNKRNRKLALYEQHGENLGRLKLKTIPVTAFAELLLYSSDMLYADTSEANNNLSICDKVWDLMHNHMMALLSPLNELHTLFNNVSIQHVFERKSNDIDRIWFTVMNQSQRPV